jgi:hypothetical protein
MREQPLGDALLACARGLLRDEVLPALPVERRHALLMAMNAMQIAERQLKNGQAPLDEEQAALAALLGQDACDLPAANRVLAQRIRAGQADPGQPQRAALLAHLRAVGRARLAESNPKVLARA